jgi:hypothetical protein
MYVELPNALYSTVHICGLTKVFFTCVCSVPDRRSRSLEVVIVRRLVTWVLGIWRGEGLGKG